MAKLKFGTKNIKEIPFYKSGTIHPSGTLTVSAQSGVYDVTNYAFVDVNYETLMDKRIFGTFSGSFYNSEFSAIKRPYAFAGTDIIEIILPNCNLIDANNAFASCYSLSTINLPNCSRIDGYSVFCNCSSLTSVSLPNCSYLG